MSSFVYQALPEEPNVTRMVHLLPHTDRNTPIECTIFEYNLSEEGNLNRAHSYVALSYCWGSDVKSESVTLNSRILSVTKNLHTALLYLRDPQLTRTFWIDAICINQDDKDEKSKQIPLMRTIYAQADHVIVWLGEGSENGEEALRSVHYLARQDDNSRKELIPEHLDARSKLLQRDWFRRIWVLQEVGVARCIYLMCGSIRISGHVFCESLIALGLPPSLIDEISPVAYLIKDAPFRSRFEIDSRGALPMGELIGMYGSHRATQRRDKIYALLGLSSDGDSTSLQPKYGEPWHTVFENFTSHIFPGTSIQTWASTETAIIKAKGWILGPVHYTTQDLSKYGQQTITILFNNTARSLGFEKAWEADWEILGCAELIQDGDIIWLLEGSCNPSILRLCNDHFRVILPEIRPKAKKETIHPKREMRYTTWRALTARPKIQDQKEEPHPILLAWSIPVDEAETNFEAPLKLTEVAPEFQECQNDIQSRMNHIGRVVVDIVAGVRVWKRQGKALEHLLHQSGTCVPILELLKIASENLTLDPLGVGSFFGEELMPILLEHRGENLPVSEEVVKRAAGHPGAYGPNIMKLLFEHRKESLPVSEDVVKEAAGNIGEYGPEIMEILFKQRGKTLPVSKDVVKAVFGKSVRYGSKMLEVLFKQRRDNLPISKDVVKAAVGIPGEYGLGIMEVLFKYRGNNLPVSMDVVKAAARNSGEYGPKMMEMLFKYRGETLPVPEGVVKAAARSSGNYRLEMIEVLLRHRGKDVPISEDVVEIVAGLYSREEGPKIMELLFQERKGDLPITEKVVKAAASNPGPHAPEMMEVLFKHRGESLPVSDQIVGVAANNPGPYSAEMLEVLFKHRGRSLKITDEVIKAVEEDPEIMELVLKHGRRSH
ncbi:heterokaryon incompatibility protein-domain-containing protein [Penicillium angulare]|uniref:Heterokaryon incompatibility protein-domain-containing protein n=1 Tax=Penicillium angulare TaxID=116970 RepID=A0A9W9GDL7_9EURO|nr:heterokaryon incompatibility protein-domain-containing protein [Penicillium angulare]